MSNHNCIGIIIYNYNRQKWIVPWMETAGKLSKTLKFDLLRGHSALQSKSIDQRSEKFFHILTLGPPVTAPVIYLLKVMSRKSPAYHFKLLLFIQNFYIEKNLKSHRLCDNELMKYTDKAFKSLNFCEKKEDAVHPDLLNQLYFSSDITETKKKCIIW